MEIRIRVTPDFGQVAKVFAGIDLNRPVNVGLDKFAFAILSESKKVTPVDTGRLRGSERVDKAFMQRIIAPHTDYAIHVHEGTFRMRARPYMLHGLAAAMQRLDVGQPGEHTDPIKKEIDREFEKEFAKLK